MTVAHSSDWRRFLTCVICLISSWVRVSIIVKAALSWLTLNDVKGFEFSVVLLLDTSDPQRDMYDDFPSASVPWAERWRDVMRLYVAMTRARDNVYMIYINNPSILLRGIWDLGNGGTGC